MIRTVLRWSFWLLLTLVTVASLAPTAHLPPQVFDIWDKAQYAVGFLMLTGLGALAYPMPAWRWGFAMALYGASIEALQAATGWRTGDPLDWVADMTGVAVALLFLAIMPRPARPSAL